MGPALIHDLAVDADEWAGTPVVQRDALRRLASRLKSDPSRAGERIQADRIPKRFRPYKNLYRVGLPERWRALYTIRVRKDVPPGVRVVFIGDHKRYDRLFGH